MKTTIVLLLAAACLFAAHTSAISLGRLTSAGVTGAVDLEKAGKSPDLGREPMAPHKHTLQVVVTGSPAGCAIQLEGTLDDPEASPYWANLSGSQTCTSSVTFHVADKPVRAVRANLTSLSGGSSPAVTIKYLGVQ